VLFHYHTLSTHRRHFSRPATFISQLVLPLVGDFDTVQQTEVENSVELRESLSGWRAVRKGTSFFISFFPKPFYCRIALEVGAVVVGSCLLASFVLNEICMDLFIFAYF